MQVAAASETVIFMGGAGGLKASSRHALISTLPQLLDLQADAAFSA